MTEIYFCLPKQDNLLKKKSHVKPVNLPSDSRLPINNNTKETSYLTDALEEDTH